jgi:hypothetical protein
MRYDAPISGMPKITHYNLSPRVFGNQIDKISGGKS